MSLSDVPEIFVGQDLEVDFFCFEDDGTTPVDMTPDGVVEFRVWRSGLTPFDVVVDTDSQDATWTDRSAGTGTMTVRLGDLDLPTGLCRYQLRATDSAGVSRIQKLDWLRLKYARR
jgi:hypothetical protein